MDNTASPTRLAYKPHDAAAALGISRAKVFELLKTGELASIRHGRTRLISGSRQAPGARPPMASSMSTPGNGIRAMAGHVTPLST